MFEIWFCLCHLRNNVVYFCRTETFKIV